MLVALKTPPLMAPQTTQALLTMTRQFICVAVLAFTALSSQAAHAAPPQCSVEARQQAKRLLVLHTDNDDRAEVDQAVKELPPLLNPADKRQRFSVLEVWGYVYKGQYRMRFIYARSPGNCLLMGQEILEHARP